MAKIEMDLQKMREVSEGAYAKLSHLEGRGMGVNQKLFETARLAQMALSEFEPQGVVTWLVRRLRDVLISQVGKTEDTLGTLLETLRKT